LGGAAGLASIARLDKSAVQLLTVKPLDSSCGKAAYTHICPARCDGLSSYQLRQAKAGAVRSIRGPIGVQVKL